jgi:phosphatidate cytidylyltransferase
MIRIVSDPIINQCLIVLLSLLALFAVFIVLYSIFLLARGKKQEALSLWVKYLVWFAIIPVLLFPLLIGRNYFISLILILSLLCYREFTRAVGLWKDAWFCWVGYISIVLIHVGVYIDWFGLYNAVPIYCMLVTLAIPIFRGEFENMIQKTCLTVLGILYFGWFFSHIGFLTNMQNGFGHIFFLFVLVELNDAMAFLSGKLFGKHKMTPKISPNKTWEGAAGAMLATIGFAFIFRFAIPQYADWQVLAIGLLLSIGGTFGDLVISFIKRDLQLKDMGQLIPGHGGLLDRFDSIVFAAPIFFHFTRYFFWTSFFKP